MHIKYVQGGGGGHMPIISVLRLRAEAKIPELEAGLSL